MRFFDDIPGTGAYKPMDGRDTCERLDFSGDGTSPTPFVSRPESHMDDGTPDFEDHDYYHGLDSWHHDGVYGGVHFGAIEDSAEGF